MHYQSIIIQAENMIQIKVNLNFVLAEFEKLCDELKEMHG